MSIDAPILAAVFVSASAFVSFLISISLVWVSWRWGSVGAVNGSCVSCVTYEEKWREVDWMNCR